MTRAWRRVATLGLVASAALVLATWAPPGGPLGGARPAPAVPTPGLPATSHPATSSPSTAGSRPGSPPTDSAVPLPRGEVVSLSLPASGYASDVRRMAVGSSGVINPPDFLHVFAVTDKGVPASGDARDTAYFACHTDGRKPVAAVPCNLLTGETVQVDDPLEVGLTDGVLRYRVVQARKVPRDAFEHDREVWDVTPGRVVLVTCYLSGGRRTDYNFVIIADPVTATER